MSIDDYLDMREREAQERVQRALRQHVRDEIPAWFIRYTLDELKWSEVMRKGLLVSWGKILLDDAINFRIENMPDDEREQLEAELERELFEHDDTPPPIERPR